MKIYTAGMLKSFLDCPQKFRCIFEEHIEIPADDSFSLTGKKIHSLIYYFLKGEDISKMKECLKLPKNKDLSALWENFLSFNVKNIIESEYTFNVVLNSETIISGRVDAIRKDGKNIEILDWKTGSSKNINPEKDMQTIVYMYSVFKLFKQYGKIDKPDDLSMTYYFLKEKIYKTIYFSQEKYIEFEKILSDLTAKISKCNKYNLYKVEKCSACSFKIVCKGTSEGLNDVL